MEGLVVTMPRNSIKADKAIGKMPFSSWVELRAFSKDAQLSPCIMSKFLMQARKKGIVEKKVVSNGAVRFHLWRRIA